MTAIGRQIACLIPALVIVSVEAVPSNTSGYIGVSFRAPTAWTSIWVEAVGDCPTGMKPATSSSRYLFDAFERPLLSAPKSRLEEVAKPPSVIVYSALAA